MGAVPSRLPSSSTTTNVPCSDKALASACKHKHKQMIVLSNVTLVLRCTASPENAVVRFRGVKIQQNWVQTPSSMQLPIGTGVINAYDDVKQLPEHPGSLERESRISTVVQLSQKIWIPIFCVNSRTMAACIHWQS
jgi:hypothetical protein